MKRIRKELAQQNDIEYAPSDCTHEGPCLGVCPACQKEADYILEELQRRIDKGTPVELNVDLEEKLSSLEEEDDEYETGDTNITINSDGMIPDEEMLMGEPYIEDFPLQGCIKAPNTGDDQVPEENDEIDDW